MTAQKRLLDAVLEDVAAAEGALIVFDLDDTLFSTNDRHLRILREYAERIATRAPEAAALLRSVRRENLRYRIVDVAKDVGLEETLAKDLKDFWYARFFQNRYLLEDGVVPGAPDYCAEIRARGGILVYMTGRDETMRAGTEQSFVRHGFPQPDGKTIRLVLKPRFDTPDSEFKGAAMRDLGAWGSVIATFENEPTHVNLFRETFPKARHFLLETKHSGRPVTPHPDAHRIKDFRR